MLPRQGRALLLMLQQQQQTSPGVFGLCGKVFVVMGATAVAPVRHCQKLPPCLTKQMSGGSRKDPVLAKAEPISPGGCTSGITDIRRGKGKRADVVGREK